ncbi:hypothetical protein [Chitinophaga japonensis]|uniref:Uncharacterized protein n=1 Tax=Chitinophaga japonensis TaxID=104662 RepID=A0A562T6F9_CHIJA|nr:hypothetical protein [Chitinophaga japonensis]TWI88858.1 hypothetical protein LX66_2945 [Chitinophaga japonensis]
MKKISLMAVTALITTGAFAGDGNIAARAGIALNRMEIRQQREQNYDLEEDIRDQQQQLFDLIKEQSDIKSDLQALNMKRQEAFTTGHSSRAARLDKKIAWEAVLLKANRDHVRECLAAEKSDMHLVNHNSARIEEEQAAIRQLN